MDINKNILNTNHVIDKAQTIDRYEANESDEGKGKQGERAIDSDIYV